MSDPRADDQDEVTISVEGLTCQFGKVMVVDHIDCSVPYGEIFGLLGANGAGKSTTRN